MRATWLLLSIVVVASTVLPIAAAKPMLGDHPRPHGLPQGLAKRIEVPSVLAPEEPVPNAPSLAAPEEPVAEPPRVSTPQSQPQPVAEAPVQKQEEDPMDAPEAAPDIGLRAAVSADDAPRDDPGHAADAPAPAPQVAVPVAGDIEAPAALTVLGIALGATGVAAGIRVARNPPTWWPGRSRPQAAPTGIAQLLERVDRNPFDGEARFRLGLELLERGREQDALRLLAQAFRYHPQSVLELLREPKYEAARRNAGVREILRRFQRETSRRLWTGYA